MWKEYTKEYIRQNRAICASVMAAALIAALFLSFLCGLFYNFWRDDIAGVVEEEGSWHGRLTGMFAEEDLSRIGTFDHVKQVSVNEELSGEAGMVVDIVFDPVRAVRKDMPSIAAALGLEEDAVSYHFQLLSLYFVRIPGDEYPRLVMPFYLAIIGAVCISMVLVIYNAFAFTMNTRVHQFGIFASVGATPAQIRICLLQEAFRMTMLPLLSGILLGVILCRCVFGAIIRMTEQIVGGRSAVFTYPPVLLAITFVIAVAAVFMAAWMPARKMSRMTPLEAICGNGEMQLTKRKHSPILSFLFGIEGELAGNFLKAQKKAFRTTNLSLTLSFMGFMLVQCFFTLSDISTEETYFARYQDVWDIMVTVPDTGIGEIQTKDMQALRALSGIKDVALYQKAEAVCQVPETWLSKEVTVLGGLEVLTDGQVMPAEEGVLMVKAPVVVLDDESFRQYCGQIAREEAAVFSEAKGAGETVKGVVVINRVWDSLHSHFRNRSYVPFVQETQDTVILCEAEQGGNTAKIPILAYGEEAPLLREEYEDYALVQIIPQSFWGQIKEQIGGAEQDTYIRILAEDRTSPAQLTQLEKNVGQMLGESYSIESENRLAQKTRNDEIIAGYKFVLGGVCVLLAIIGIANVFSNTLGFLRLRKREVVRYLSVGVTPCGVGKIFVLEALVTAGRPVLITLPLVTVLIGLMIKASYLNPMVFIKRAPIGQIMLFVVLIFGFVALAYYLGGKKVLRNNISEVLRDDVV